MELELRHLRVVCAIADAGSITRASAELGVSQPALTAQLQRIERGLGGRLFDRDRNGVAATPLGAFVLTRARAVLLGMDELSGAVTRRRPDTVTLGGFAAPVCIGLADRLCDHLPDVEIRLHTEYSPRLLWDLMIAGRLDAALLADYPGYTPAPPQGVRRAVLAVEPVFLALWAGHELAGRAEVELADLAGSPLALTPPDGMGWPECFNTACARAGFQPWVPYQIHDADSIRALVAGRRAVSPCQATFRADGQVTVRPIAGAPVRMRHLLAWREDSPLAASAEAMLGFARDAYAASIDRSPAYRSWLSRHGSIDYTSDGI